VPSKYVSKIYESALCGEWLDGSYNKENTKLKAKEIRESRQIRQVISSVLFRHDAIVVLHQMY